MEELPKVSFGQLLTWDRCRWQWSAKYIHKMDTTKKRVRMGIGSMGHEMLFDWYKTGQDHSDIFLSKWMQDWEHLDGEQINGINIAVLMFKMYLSEFSPMHDRNYQTQSLEEHFQVPLTTPTGSRFELEGYIDRTSIDQRGNLWVEDYKWTSRFWSPLQLQMDPQLTFYAGALRAMGRPVHGTMITQVNTYDYKDRTKKTVDDMFRRELIYRSPAEIDAVMLEIGRTVDEMLEARELPVFKRNLRRDCADCDFAEPCLLGLKGIDSVEFMQRSPGFKPREKRPVLQLEIEETPNDNKRHLHI